MADAPELQRRIDDLEIARNTLSIPHPYTLADAESWLAKKERGDDEAAFAITMRDDGTLAGCVGIIVHESDALGVLGYWIAAAFRNRGFVSEAVERVLRYGFEDLALNRVEAEHFSRNPASGRVMQKCGMRHEGTLRQRHRKWGEPLDCELYAILRSDWQG